MLLSHIMELAAKDWGRTGGWGLILFSWSPRLLIHAFRKGSKAENWWLLGTELKITLSCCAAPDPEALIGNRLVALDSRESGEAILGLEKPWSII